MLPVSYQQVQINMFQYNPQNPPVVFQIQAPQEIQAYVPTITALIANILQQHAGTGNPQAIFATNWYGMNGWNNQQFLEFVRFMTFYCYIQYTRGYYNGPVAAVQAISAGEGLMLYLSKLFVDFPELKSVAPPDRVQAAFTNIQYLNDMQNQINDLVVRMTGQPAVVAPPPMANNYGMPQAQQPYQQRSYNDARRSVPMAAAVGQHQRLTSYSGANTSIGFSGTPGDDLVATPDDRVANYMRKTYGDAPQAVQHSFPTFSAPHHVEQVQAFEVQPVNDVKVSDWTPNPEQPYRCLLDPTSQAVSYAAFGNYVVELVTDLDKEEEMDRSKHQMAVLGNSFEVDVRAQRGQIELASQNLSTITSTQIENAANELGEENISEEAQSVIDYVYPRWITTNFLESLIFEGRMLQNSRPVENEGIGVYRTFGIVAKPVFTAENYSKMISTSFSTFGEIATKLKEYGMAANTIQAEATEQKRKNIRDMVGYLVEVERVLVDLVNDFLQNKLALETKISSLIEDVADIPNYLANTYSIEYASAFERWEREIVPTLFEEISDDVNEIQLSGNQQPVISLIPINYSITHVDMYAAEFGVEINDGESLLIQKRKHNWLWNLAKSVFEQKSGVGMESTYDLLVTADDVIFMIHKGYVGRGENYLISKF